MAPSPFKLKVIVMIFLFPIVLLILLHFHPRPPLPLLPSFCSSNNTISNSSLTVKLFDGLISATSNRRKTYTKEPFSLKSELLNQTMIGGFTSSLLLSQYSEFDALATHSIVKRKRRSNLSKQIFQKRRRLDKNSPYKTVNHPSIYIPSTTFHRRKRNVKINYRRIVDFVLSVANWRLNLNYGRHPIHSGLPLATITFTPWTFFLTILSFVSYLMTADPSHLSKLLIVTQIVNG